MRPLLLLLSAPVLLIAGCTKDAGQVSFGGDTASAAGDTADTIATGATGGAGEVFSDDDPFFALLLDGSGWSVDPVADGNQGYYTASSLYASEGDSGSAQTFSIQIDGDLQQPGRYAVTYMSYTQQVSQATPTVQDVDSPEGFTIVVQGYAETGYSDQQYVYAESEGTATLSDGTEVSSVQVTNYPYIF